jgi:hypothetical protein
MNERIKELKQQAREFYLLQEDLDCSTKQLHELVEAKFAELLIQKCVAISDDYVKDCTCEEHVNCKHPRSAIGKKIREHFGVKE